MSSEVGAWRRLHAVSSVVTLVIVRSPIEGWLVRAEGWTLPAHFPVVYASLEAAQRASDDVLINYQPHDCVRCRCGEWQPMKGSVLPPTTMA